MPILQIQQMIQEADTNGDGEIGTYFFEKNLSGALHSFAISYLTKALCEITDIRSVRKLILLLMQITKSLSECYRNWLSEYQEAS